MRGLVLHGPQDVRYDTVSDARIHDRGDAVVAVTHAGICGSDLHVYHATAAHASGHCMGHEAIGTIVEVGADVRRWRVGDRVMIPPGIVCDGTCDGCRAGQSCRRPPAIFGISLSGSQAEAVTVPSADANLTRQPDTVSDENALLLTDCTMTAWYGAHRASIRPGATVAVIGLGPIGLVTVMVAFALGAARVVGVDPVAERRRRAEALAATAVDVDTAEETIGSMTGRGADSVIEAVGADESIQLALRVVKPGGTVSIVGVPQSDGLLFPLRTAQMKSIELRTGLARFIDLPGLVRLIASERFDPSSVISHRMPLSEGAAAYAMSAARRPDVCKVVLDPAR